MSGRRRWWDLHSYACSQLSLRDGRARSAGGLDALWKLLGSPMRCIAVDERYHTALPVCVRCSFANGSLVERERHKQSARSSLVCDQVSPGLKYSPVAPLTPSPTRRPYSIASFELVVLACELLLDSRKPELPATPLRARDFSRKVRHRLGEWRSESRCGVEARKVIASSSRQV